jgi:hypothetical protein
VSNYQTLFSHFFGAWKAFLLKLENIHQMAKKSGESRLAPKCQQCFDVRTQERGVAVFSMLALLFGDRISFVFSFFFYCICKMDIAVLYM